MLEMWQRERAVPDVFLFFEKVLYEVNATRLRGGSRTAATFKMERFVIIVNGFQPLITITKRSILDVAAVLDPPLRLQLNFNVFR